MDFDKKYSNKEILIIGGGTSTVDRKWENIISSDMFVWTCNDFYKNSRVVNQDIDLYQLAYTTDLKDSRLIKILKEKRPFTYFEPDHFGNRKTSTDFINFQKNIGYTVIGMNAIDIREIEYSEGRRSGAILRLIMLALTTKAKNIYFVGFDGFNKSFSNAHAFSGHIGLKDTDLRRDWKTGYYNVFMEAYLLLCKYDKFNRLQNLGEGLEYNIGTPISKKYFPLKKEIYEAIR